MDKETKDIIRPLLECIASLTTNQAAILEFLAANAPEPVKSQFLSTAKENDKRAEEFRQHAASLI